jgi:serine phosphatase RsbU (regulator of sigma subunit)
MLEQSWEAEPSPATRLAGRTLYGVQLSARIMVAGDALAGGDWCEGFAVAAGVIALSIGDVCGHGDGAFATRVAIRAAIRDAAHRGLDPAQTLIAAHYALRSINPDTFATAIFGLLNVEKKTFAFANAGHPAPLLCGVPGAEYLEYPETFLPLGMEESTVPQVRTIDVPDSSLLVLYTDGVTEHRREPLHGAAELRDAALYAYSFQAQSTAGVIELQMDLVNSTADDAAILTAWTPRRSQPTSSTNRALR